MWIAAMSQRCATRGSPQPGHQGLARVGLVMGVRDVDGGLFASRHCHMVADGFAKEDHGFRTADLEHEHGARAARLSIPRHPNLLVYPSGAAQRLSLVRTVLGEEDP